MPDSLFLIFGIKSRYSWVSATLADGGFVATHESRISQHTWTIYYIASRELFLKILNKRPYFCLFPRKNLLYFSKQKFISSVILNEVKMEKVSPSLCWKSLRFKGNSQKPQNTYRNQKFWLDNFIPWFGITCWDEDK